MAVTVVVASVGAASSASIAVIGCCGDGSGIGGGGGGVCGRGNRARAPYLKGVDVESARGR